MATAWSPLPRRWSPELLRRLEVATERPGAEGGFFDAVEDFDAGFFGIAAAGGAWRWIRSSG